MIKLNKVGREGTCLNFKKAICDKITANFMHTDEK